MDIVLKELDENDRVGLRDILKNSFDTLSTLDTLELDCYIDGQQRPCQWYVARSGRQVIGCINASTRSNEGYINSLSVREEFRGRGIGKLLVQKAINWLVQEYDCESVFLYVRPSNTSATAFYEKLGFVNCGLTKSQTLEDVLMLRKKI
ncbi:MAG: GNAT family N-acetyltransferase [Promethearchaeota archaeon]